MKTLPLQILSVLLIITSCRNAPDNSSALKAVAEDLQEGNITHAIDAADSLKAIIPENSMLYYKADSLSEIGRRILIDYSLSRDQITERLRLTDSTITPEEISQWDGNGWLDSRTIDGRRMYFKRAASNLNLIRKFRSNTESRFNEISSDSEMIFRKLHTEAVLKSAAGRNDPVEPVPMKITYTITVHADAVPEGEKIRCWLPWPREDNPRQKSIRLLSASQPAYTISPDTSVHSTIYMERIGQKGKPSVFSITFSYVSFAQHFDLNTIKNEPYDRNSDLYKKYTSEQLPHINFSPEIKKLADSISGINDGPVETVRKIYYWFKENIPWSGAPEYSIIPDIAGYTCNKMTGDCGMQTFLFMSMLRYKGIPVRWQSGWMLPPHAENLHDWCEVYYEGTGWIPADVSYDLQKSGDKNVHEYFLSGVDSYRLIINQGIAGPLHPGKLYLRSEPYDFQRGEVEWKGGNLYFDKWNYDINIAYGNN
jgi:hypothetical protein